MHIARLASSLAALVVLAVIVALPTVAWSGPICFDSCQPRQNYDFNADGKADLIRTGPTGIRVNLIDGTSSVGTGVFPNGGGTFELKAVGLLNGDNSADFVSQGNGTARVTFVNAAGTGTAGTLFIADGGGVWNVVGVADVNGDAIDEVLFEGTGAATGALRIANIASGSPIFSYLATGGGIWSYALAADLNGDASKDLLFRGSGSASGLVRANPGGGTANVKFFPQGGSAWTLRLAGDLNGDGIDDLVDVSGNAASAGFDRVRVFDTLGTGNPSATGFVPTAGGSFALKAIGDFDGDTKADLGYDGAASFRIVAMNGVNPTASYFPSNGGGAFLLRRMGDTNADGKYDLISTNAAGDVRIQLSNGAAPTTNSAQIASAGLSQF